MEFIRDWVRNIAIMVICLGFLELILPQNSMERLVRVVIGLVIVVVIISPLIGLLQGKGLPEIIGGQGSAGWGFSGTSRSSGDDYIAAGRAVAQAGYASVAGDLEGRIAKQVEAVAAMASWDGGGKAAVKLDSEGNIQEIILYYRGAAPSVAVIRSLAKFYGIPEERVRALPKSP